MEILVARPARDVSRSISSRLAASVSTHVSPKRAIMLTHPQPTPGSEPLYGLHAYAQTRSRIASWVSFVGMPRLAAARPQNVLYFPLRQFASRTSSSPHEGLTFSNADSHSSSPRTRIRWMTDGVKSPAFSDCVR